MSKPKALVMSGYGLNCEEETRYAFELAGAQADIVHINDLIDRKKYMENYQILAFPGGFSYADDIGSGRAFANKVKNHLSEALKKFIQKEKLVIGICNGFQILANLDIFSVKIALTHNANARYTVRWVDVKVENDSPWFRGIDTISLPIAHGEGKLYADPLTLSHMNKKHLVALRYMKGSICTYQNLIANPNGSLDNIAGITDESGRVFGLMPHPERAVFFTQLPNWPYIKESYERLGKPLPKKGPGLDIYKNAVLYFT